MATFKLRDLVCADCGAMAGSCEHRGETARVMHKDEYNRAPDQLITHDGNRYVFKSGNIEISGPGGAWVVVQRADVGDVIKFLKEHEGKR